VVRNTVAPVSALVTVTVSTEAGGVINVSGDDAIDGMATELQAGIGTAEAACVALGAGRSVVLGLGAHPTTSVATTVPKSADRSL
jgi:hypothetical protein